MTRLRRATIAAGLLYGLALALVAFWPTPVDAGVQSEIRWLVLHVQRLGWQSFDYARLESLGNVALFLPFGFLTAVLLSAREWWAAIVLGVTTSAVIETGQFLFLGSRFATLEDVLMNGIGTVLGVGAGLAAHAVLRRTPYPRALTAH